MDTFLINVSDMGMKRQKNMAKKQDQGHPAQGLYVYSRIMGIYTTQYPDLQK
jgi:hypothetical protein